MLPAQEQTAKSVADAAFAVQPGTAKPRDDKEKRTEPFCLFRLYFHCFANIMVKLSEKVTPHHKRVFLFFKEV